MHSHATWSFAACSRLLNGLRRTVTTIFSSLALGPPGVDAGVLSALEDGVVTGVLSIFEAGVAGGFIVVMFTFVVSRGSANQSKYGIKHFQGSDMNLA